MKENMMKASIAIALLALSISCYTYAESKVSAQYDKCVSKIDNSALGNSQLTSCANQEAKRQDVALNAEYNMLRGRISAEQKDQLTKAQKAWLKFRDEWCRFEEIGPADPGGETGRALCVIDLTGRQVELIKAQ
jgi:uncharacterized protein YecT (DUF1311 family)